VFFIVSDYSNAQHFSPPKLFARLSFKARK